MGLHVLWSTGPLTETVVKVEIHLECRDISRNVLNMSLIANKVHTYPNGKKSRIDLGDILIRHIIVIHYNDAIMGAVSSQITSLTIVYSTVDSDADQRNHQSSASLAFLRGIHRGPVNSPHKWPVTRKVFPFDDVIMAHCLAPWCWEFWKYSTWSYLSCILFFL